MVIDKERFKRGTEIATLVALRSVERKYWKQEAAELLIIKGVCSPQDTEAAQEYAESLMYRNLDETGVLLVSPQEAVDDDIIYPLATMS
jgi:3-deoxy-D-arabino-heptulosonate 7-phosphate (DAHP) synthase